MLSVQNLKHSLGEKHIKIKEWTVPYGRSTLVLGASGSGKTTFLHILAGLIKPDDGKIICDGQDIYRLSPFARDRFRGENIGMVFQTLHLLRHLTVYQNLKVARHAVGKPIDIAEMDGIIETLDIGHLKNRKAASLSYGEAQRVAIARALANDPKIILADEPTSSLDDKDFDIVEKVLIDLSLRTGVTLVIATHDRRLKDRFDLQMRL